MRVCGGGTGGGGGGGGGGRVREGGEGADVGRQRKISVDKPSQDAPNSGDRTPGSQTPGVPATLGLNVQTDGGRKMLRNCSKIPPDALDRDVDERI